MIIKIIKSGVALILFLKEVGGLNENFYTQVNKGLKKMQLTLLKSTLVLFRKQLARFIV